MRKLPNFIQAGLVCALAFAAVVRAPAQSTINASASVVGALSGGSYNYTLTLQNAGTSTDPIYTLWYAWFPGADLMSATPFNITPPSGWTYSLVGGPYYVGPYYYPDGYSIEFTTTDVYSALQPGYSLDFGFSSAEDPTSMSGPSPYPYYAPNYYATAISYVYANSAPGAGQEPTGTSSSFAAVVATPEPTSLALLTVGAGALWAARKRFRR